MKSISVAFLLMAAPLFSMASDFRIDGRYTQLGTCQCENDSQGKACAEVPLAVHAFATSSLVPNYARWSAETGETVTDSNGHQKVVRVWIYPRSQKFGDEFRAGALDQLSYQVSSLSSGRGFEITVTNISRPQEPLVISLEAPADQDGGKVDGPVDYKTVIDDSQFQHTNYSVVRDAGGTAGPGHSAPGNKHMLDFFQMKKASQGILTIARIFDYKFARYGLGTPRTFNYGLQACALQKASK